MKINEKMTQSLRKRCDVNLFVYHLRDVCWRWCFGHVFFYFLADFYTSVISRECRCCCVSFLAQTIQIEIERPKYLKYSWPKHLKIMHTDGYIVWMTQTEYMHLYETNTYIETNTKKTYICLQYIHNIYKRWDMWRIHGNIYHDT